MGPTLTSLSTEVLLRVLGYLDDPRDVVHARSVNRRMQSIAGDALLWRDLFIHTFLKLHSTSSNVATPPPPAAKKRRRLSNHAEASQRTPSIPSRVIRDIPRLRSIQAGIDVRDDEADLKVDWLSLFKISRNWQLGNFSTKQLQAGQEGRLGGGKGKAADLASFPVKTDANTTQTIVASTSTHVFAAFNSAKSEQGESTSVFAFRSDGRKNAKVEEDKEESVASFVPFFSQSEILKQSPPIRVTSLTVDQRPSTSQQVQLFVACSNGKAVLVQFNLHTNNFSREVIVESRGPPIVAVTLHSPLLVTCTADFCLRIYQVSSDKTKLLEQRRSYSCHWPASLRLESVREPGAEESFKFSIAYSTPVYPLGWTVGLQEITIKKDLSTTSRSTSARQAYVVTRIDSPRAKMDQLRNVSSETDISIEDRRKEVGRLTSLSYEAPYIVVGTKDNDVICYKVEGYSEHEELSIMHVCNFQGHTGTVHSVSLNEGRCVTGGSDGSVCIWKLGDEEAAMAKAAGLLTTFDASLRKGLGRVVSIAAALTPSMKKKRKLEESRPLTLAEILREARHGAASHTTQSSSSSSSAAVRWVTSGFDQIISVSSVRTTRPLGLQAQGSCRTEVLAEQEEEQVQIWSFAQ